MAAVGRDGVVVAANASPSDGPALRARNIDVWIGGKLGLAPGGAGLVVSITVQKIRNDIHRIIALTMGQGHHSTHRSTPVWVKTLIVIAVGLTYWKALLSLCASLHFNDFGKFYYGVVSWRAGGSLYALSPASYIGDLPDALTNLNPPHAMLAVWPVSFLAIGPAFAVWMGLNAVGLALSAVMVGRQTGWRPGYWQLMVLLLGAPTAGWLVTGQLTGLLAVPLACAWRDWRANRGFRGGLWFGLVLSIKPFLGVFVPWFIWRRDWSALKGTLIGASATMAAGLAAFGPFSYVEWANATASISWTWGALNASALGIVTRVFSVTPYHVPIAVYPSIVLPVWGMICAGIVAVLGHRLRHASVDRAWFLLMAGALLISPLGWVYYLWWVLPGLPTLPV